MNIEYVEEKELEEVFSGTLVLDGIPMTEEEQRKRIIEMMHLAGVEVDNEDNLVIQYEGADDDFGISETQSTKFSVMNEVIKKVPYKVTREEVFEGTFILDGIPMTEEEQRERIFNMMTLAGVEVGNKDELEIGYEGAEDDFGISETESTRFIVTRVKRERLEDDTKKILEDDTKEILEDDTKEIVDDDLKINNDIDDKLLDELNKSLNDIKDIREKLDNIKDSTNRNDLILEALEKTKNLEDKLKEKGLLATEFEEELESLNIEISRLEKEIKEETKKYEESYKKLTKLITEQNEKLSNGELLTEEEYNKIKEEYLRLIEEENNVSVIIKNNIELRKKEISNLKRKRNKIQKDINTAKALGLSTSEYIELTSTLRKKRIMDAILKEKGLSEIISKKASERTKEETELLKATKEQIIKEIAEIQKEKNISALEAIEIFYNIDTKVLLVKKSRKDTLTSTEIENIKNKVNKTPNKVHKKDKQEINYTPDPAPIDIPIEEKEEEKEELEVIRLIKEDEKFYVNKKTLFRFVLDSVGKELEIDGEKFYRIDREDAEYIIGNANNKYSPYKAEVTELEIEKEEEEKVDIDYTNEDVTEVIALLRDVKDDNKIYVRKNTMLRFTLDAIGEEIEIDGAVYYPIAEEDAKYIIGNANNNYSPYTVEIRDFDKNKSEDDEDEIEDDIEYTDEDVREVIKLFRDVDNENKMYVKEPVVKRFNLTVDEFDAVEIDDTKCFPIDEDDAKYIIGNADNGYSPYTVEIEDVHLGKKLDPTTDEDICK